MGHATPIRQKTLKAWVEKQYDRGELKDIYEHGMQAGFHGAICYWETGHLYTKFQDEIWTLLDEQYKEFGHKNALELIASFNGAENVGSQCQFENLLVWYAIEHYAQESSR